MKITITEIEATAEDMRASRTLADSISCAFARIANSICYPNIEADKEDREEDKDE